MKVLTPRPPADDAGPQPASRPVCHPPPAGPWLVVDHLTKSYGGWGALRGVSFELTSGTTGLLGPNGAGKSTLLRCLAGITGWDSGRIVVNGVEAEARPRAARAAVGFMPERVAFPGEMRVEAYLRFAAAAKGIRWARRREAVEAALSRSGLLEARSRILANLSKGFRQRVGLAQALVGDPPVLLLDEPTAGLDPLNVLEVRQVLTAYATNHLVIISTHTLAEAQALCEHLVVLAAGAVVYQGPVAELAARARATGDASHASDLETAFCRAVLKPPPARGER